MTRFVMVRTLLDAPVRHASSLTSSGDVNFPCNRRDLAGRKGSPGRESESIDQVAPR